ncbi:unnamed protein product [Rotaria magnacalcarata]|uniref:VWFA domain-containing protein n=2 Tax=Rotaria magnacalcarata TaxID=392030 RepID=A0A816QIB3_9BILA|nr:unnamed protein product [Rotaria magnacalcarata]
MIYVLNVSIRIQTKKGHRDTHSIIPIEQPQKSSQIISDREESSISNFLPRQIDVSLAIHSYNIVLVVDVSQSMIERGIIRIANQLVLNDRLTCLAFNAEVYEVMDTESADVAKLKPALVLSALNLSIDNANAGTALYDTIDSTFQVLLRNKFAGILTGDSNRNQIILISDGADCSSTKCNLHQACQRVNRFMMIVKLICY